MKITPSRGKRFFSLISYLFLGMSICYALYQYPRLAELIPGHFTFEGRVDRYVSKDELFFLPASGLLVMLSLGFLSKKAPLAKLSISSHGK